MKRPKKDSLLCDFPAVNCILRHIAYINDRPIISWMSNGVTEVDRLIG